MWLCLPSAECRACAQHQLTEHAGRGAALQVARSWRRGGKPRSFGKPNNGRCVATGRSACASSAAPLVQGVARSWQRGGKPRSFGKPNNGRCVAAGRSAGASSAAPLVQGVAHTFADELVASRPASPRHLLHGACTGVVRCQAGARALSCPTLLTQQQACMRLGPRAHARTRAWHGVARWVLATKDWVQPAVSFTPTPTPTPTHASRATTRACTQARRRMAGRAWHGVARWVLATKDWGAAGRVIETARSNGLCS